MRELSKNKPSRSDIDFALTVLGLDTMPSSIESIDKAMRAEMKRVHPDHGGDAGIAAQNIQKAKWASNILKLALRAQSNENAEPVERTCHVCQGRGYARRTGFSRVDCPKCNGKGVLTDVEV